MRLFKSTELIRFRSLRSKRPHHLENSGVATPRPANFAWPAWAVAKRLCASAQKAVASWPYVANVSAAAREPPTALRSGRLGQIGNKID